MKRIISIITAAICTLSIMAGDNCTVAFTVNPPMHCQNCENKIKTNLRFEKGIKKIDTDLKGQLVTVTYDPDKTDEKKIADGFKKIGYDATPYVTPQDTIDASESRLKNKD